MNQDVHILVHYRQRKQVLEERRVWVRDRDFPNLEIPCDIVLYNNQGNTIEHVTATAVRRYIDLAPCGRGRKADDVFVCIEW